MSEMHCSCHGCLFHCPTHSGVTRCGCRDADAYSIGPRPSGIGPPPTGAPAATPGAGPGPAPPQAADAGQDAFVTGKSFCHPSGPLVTLCCCACDFYAYGFQLSCTIQCIAIAYNVSMPDQQTLTACLCCNHVFKVCNVCNRVCKVSLYVCLSVMSVCQVQL